MHQQQHETGIVPPNGTVHKLENQMKHQTKNKSLGMLDSINCKIGPILCTPQYPMRNVLNLWRWPWVKEGVFIGFNADAAGTWEIGSGR